MVSPTQSSIAVFFHSALTGAGNNADSGSDANKSGAVAQDARAAIREGELLCIGVAEVAEDEAVEDYLEASRRLGDVEAHHYRQGTSPISYTGLCATGYTIWAAS